ncbi:transcription activator GCR1-like domain-containing protein SCDLUD_004613 [Saccharomycodes ludwigii]|uniref:transcription activator GCR1-like domain-containing protein n=1 Tax=Saccharomycodes ludwigii TaxID=36035 RepID=UPI001E8BB02D|nr:hypothetical protein SCDLUD_004613 [Saccharomycodes ludwigii]KAH3899184.1 hypothetical protein SCDLUD_004613 [Saccharomycodes ludwigii]
MTNLVTPINIEVDQLPVIIPINLVYSNSESNHNSNHKKLFTRIYFEIKNIPNVHCVYDPSSSNTNNILYNQGKKNDSNNSNISVNNHTLDKMQDTTISTVTDLNSKLNHITPPVNINNLTKKKNSSVSLTENNATLHPANMGSNIVTNALAKDNDFNNKGNNIKNKSGQDNFNYNAAAKTLATNRLDSNEFEDGIFSSDMNNLSSENNFYLDNSKNHSEGLNDESDCTIGPPRISNENNTPNTIASSIRKGDKGNNNERENEEYSNEDDENVSEASFSSTFSGTTATASTAASKNIAPGDSKYSNVNDLVFKFNDQIVYKRFGIKLMMLKSKKNPNITYPKAVTQSNIDTNSPDITVKNIWLEYKKPFPPFNLSIEYLENKYGSKWRTDNGRVPKNSFNTKISRRLRIVKAIKTGMKKLHYNEEQAIDILQKYLNEKGSGCISYYFNKLNLPDNFK